MLLPFRDEAFGDATLIEHFDGAGIETPGSRPIEVLAGASLDDDDVDPCQRQFARQHQPRRTASRDHDRMFSHHILSYVSDPWPSSAQRTGMISTQNSLATSPHGSAMLLMAERA